MLVVKVCYLFSFIMRAGKPIHVHITCSDIEKTSVPGNLLFEEKNGLIILSDRAIKFIWILWKTDWTAWELVKTVHSHSDPDSLCEKTTFHTFQLIII